MYRPEDWEELVDKITARIIDDEGHDGNPALVEAGADAMLEGLIRGTQCKVGEDYFELKLPRMRGVVVFIPEEKE